jgi:ABC-type Mn2+/Zn2+ transport system permease subunit
MRGRLPRLGDRAIGIALGIVLGIAVILIFLFLGSRSTIDEPSINNIPGVTQTQTAPPPAKVSKPKELK